MARQQTRPCSRKWSSPVRASHAPISIRPAPSSPCPGKRSRRPAQLDRPYARSASPIGADVRHHVEHPVERRPGQRDPARSRYHPYSSAARRFAPHAVRWQRVRGPEHASRWVDRQREVLTGGASSVYGSDAVAGVVNFQFVDTFEGVEFEGSGTMTDQGDGEEYSAGITAGTSFAANRGSIVGHLGYARRKAIEQSDRRFSRYPLDYVPGITDGLGPGGAFVGSGSGITADGLNVVFPAGRCSTACLRPMGTHPARHRTRLESGSTPMAPCLRLATAPKAAWRTSAVNATRSCTTTGISTSTTSPRTRHCCCRSSVRRRSCAARSR